jgi:hypothetical protein
MSAIFVLASLFLTYFKVQSVIYGILLYYENHLAEDAHTIPAHEIDEQISAI